jgi:DNA-binding MarR family transcriptional regulator
MVTVRGASVRELSELAQLLTQARRLGRALNAVLVEDSLRDDLWRIMHALAESHGMLMGEIAESLVMPPATATRLVDELGDLGIVFRRPSPDDGRKAVVYLSRAGEERLQRVEAMLQARLFDGQMIFT